MYAPKVASETRREAKYKLNEKINTRQDKTEKTNKALHNRTRHTMPNILQNYKSNDQEKYRPRVTLHKFKCHGVTDRNYQHPCDWPYQRLCRSDDTWRHHQNGHKTY